MLWSFLIPAYLASCALGNFEVEHVARQVDSPGAAATSSFNWWPYPPGGVETTPSPPSPPPAPTTTISAAKNVDNPPTLADPSEPTTTSDTPESSSSDAQSTASSSSASDSDSTSQTIITIAAGSSSALPTLTRFPKKNPTIAQAPKLVYYLIPVFVVVGMIFGSLCAWFGWGYHLRKGKKKRTDLYAGPAYQSDKLRDAEEVEKGYHSDDHEDESDKPYSWADVDNAKLLAPPPAVRGYSTKKPLSRNTTNKTTRTATTRASVYSHVSDNDSDEAEAERHAEGDAEVDRFLSEYESDDDEPRGPKKRTTHVRQNSDYSVVMDRSKSAASSAWGWDGLMPAAISRASTPTGMLSRASTAKSTGGFRIMQESPIPTPNLLNISNPFAGWGKQQPSETDNYTEPPARRRDRSRSSSPVKRGGPTSRSGKRAQERGQEKSERAQTKTFHPLPSSPKQLMSPRLEDSLCFTPRASMDQDAPMQSFRLNDDVEERPKRMRTRTKERLR
ncbi:hypothetical protein CYLTODRAFT_422588 [Cylindrobasidium torrendii FP15055 ss-10]|uniref:Uncharacterized protein n=1 Tax=Cylindrobasidium torrendii FP15055 ss-10 TaxID=1314674 RepID=A0A0D7BAY2_9AGAR|nr:hypothetical protein CYLTODRAFT_422588 [Cylindrobasidium torrendii FP15055 ss-10]